ncbi:MAG: YceI family protein [Xanthomonadales bacterium]|jgi:polyisoprenoid-binding protein YceI|nr:YceI family protein [Xanthomonadales bacterium]MBK7144132.1 YceI family protein [Xanthomonadales bacterium]MCC6560506.1 YceI family protein [Xanthomonadales bacterium]
MHKSFAPLAIAALFAAAPLAAAERYEFDKAHTSILFFVEHLGLSEVQGEFRAFEGELSVDPDDLAQSSVNVAIDAASIDMDVEKLNEHLKSRDFFDIANHPKLTFKSGKVEVRGENALMVTGDLTLLGVTRSVTLDVKLKRVAAHPFAKRPALGFHAEATIQRSDFGMNYIVGSVADVVRIRIDGESIQAAPAANATP